MQIGLLSGKRVSKQAVFDRLHPCTTVFAEQLVKHALSIKACKHFKATLFKEFARVLLQGSTTLRLPQILAAMFPGNHCRGVQKAVARVQCVLDMKAMRFIDFSLGAFTQNDQSASGDIVSRLRKGDLVPIAIGRDLGYFAMATFEKIIKAQAYFLSRLKYGITLSDRNGNPIELKKLLKQKHGVDRWVYIGKEKKHGYVW